jgi:hypothetical protein
MIMDIESLKRIEKQLLLLNEYERGDCHLDYEHKVKLLLLILKGNKGV